jgi:hypothetical protein
MKIPRRGLKGYERQTSNVQHRMLNKVFCQFLNRRSDTRRKRLRCESDFIIGCLMFNVRKMLYYTV